MLTLRLTTPIFVDRIKPYMYSTYALLISRVENLTAENQNFKTKMKVYICITSKT